MENTDTTTPDFEKMTKDELHAYIKANSDFDMMDRAPKWALVNAARKAHAGETDLV